MTTPAPEPRALTEAESTKLIENVFEMKLADMTRNNGKPHKCISCRHDHEVGIGSWSEESWDLCFNCGYKKAKQRFGTPALYWDADLFMHFAYTGDEFKMLTESSLYVHGPTGTGKTYLAFAIANYLLKSRRYGGSVFVEYHDFAQAMRSAFKGPKWLSEEQIMEKYTHAPFLLLDDVFGSKDHDKPSEQENHWLYQLIRDRNHEERKTIITGNYPLSGLEDKGWNARTTSRIAQLCKSVLIDGPDRRLEVRDETGGQS